MKYNNKVCLQEKRPRTLKHVKAKYGRKCRGRQQLYHVESINKWTTNKTINNNNNFRPAADDRLDALDSKI